MRKFYVLLMAFLLSFAGNAQTVLINPAGDGGFETGPTFADNNWQVVNATTNKWFCGTVPTGTVNTSWFTGNRGAYISNDAAGATWNYSNTAASRSHIYRDVVFPAGETSITLSFDWRGNGNDGNWDNLQVYLVPTTSLPTTASPTGTSTSPSWLSGGFFLLERSGTSVPTTTTKVTFTLTAAQATYAAGNTRRLVFTWKNDGTGGSQPPAAIDNISLTSTCSAPLTSTTATAVTNNSATLNWTATAGTSFNVRYKKLADPASVSTWATPINTAATSVNLTGLSGNTQYEFQVSVANAPCTTYSASTNFTTLCDIYATPTAAPEDFANYLPSACWSEAAGLLGATVTFSSTTASNWTQDDFANVTTPVNKAAKLNIFGTGADEWLISPSYNLGTSGNKQLEFDLALTAFGQTTAANLGADDKFAVLISTDNGATWSNANLLREWNSGTPISNTGEHVVIDLSAYTGVVKFAFYGESTISNADNDLFVDNFAINIIPACAGANSIAASNVTATSAEINWVAPATPPASYDIYFSTTNTAPTASTTPSASGITAAPYLMNSLPSNTTYYVWIRGNCGGGVVGSWISLPATFTTLCSAVPSFSQNFDAVTTPALPSCWYRVGSGGSLSTQSIDASSAPNTLYLYSSSTSSIGMVSLPPVSNLGAGTHRLRFQMRANFTVGGIVEVGYLTNPTDPASFTLIESVTASSLTYQPFTVIPSAGISAEVMAFRHTGSPANSVLIDNVAWEPIPSCLEPTALTFTAITNNGATIDWTAPAISPAGYDVYYSTTNTAPTASTTPSAAGVSNPYAISGLTANTTYYVWVRGNCGANDVSVWSVVGSFTTLCDVFVTPTAAAESFTTYLPSACWSEAAGTLSGATTFTSTTTSNWLQDDFGNVASPVNKAARVNITGTTGDEWLITPSYDLGSTGNKQLEFDLALTASGATTAITLGADDKFAVLISTDNGATWSNANILREWNSGTPISNTGEHVVIDLSAYTGVVKFAFYGESTMSNVSSDLFVDNVAINVIPSCAPPASVSSSAITNVSAEINWTAPATPPASYDVYFSTSNTAPTGSTTPSVTGITGPYAMTGLTSNTTYYVWVRGNCGTGNVSTWTTLATIFTTLCDPVATFSQNFDAVTTPALPSCWYKVGSGGSLSTQSTDANSSPNTLYFYSGSTSSIGMVSLPPVSNLGAGTHRLKFNMRANFTVGGIVEVGYLTNPTDPATFTLIQSVTASALTYQPYSVVPPAGISGQNLAFRHTGSPANSVLIDDVIWEALPACLEPTNVVASSITQTGASINWTAPAVAPASYDVYYNTANTAPTAGTTPSASGVSAPYALTGLTANTRYYVWVRGNCGGSGTSAWSISGTFVTLCQPSNVPYTQNFDAVTTPALPSCTSIQNVNNDANTWVSTSAITGYTGNVLVYSWNTTNAADDWFYTAGLNLTAGKSYILSYKFGNNSTTYKEKLKVAIGSAPSATTMTEVLADYPAVDSNVARTHMIRFTVPSTGVYHIGFQAYSIADQFSLYLDDISVVEAAVSTTTVNTCVTVNAPKIDGQSNTKWMSLVDAGGNIVGEINANGNYLGNVTVKVYRNSGAVRRDFYGRYYMDRNIEITPTVQPTSPVSVRLYFTAAELAALQAQGGSNVTSFNDISVFKNNDPCGSRVINGAVKLTTVSSVFETNYVASFDVNSFSSFYLAASTYSVLPANIVNFSGVRQGGVNNLKWTVAQEQDVLEYEVERSENGGGNWTKVGTVVSLGNSAAQRSYNFADNTFRGIKQLYRLRQVDRNGVAKLSNIVSISSNRPTTLAVSGLFPNPAATKLNVLVDAPQKDNITIQVIDGVGRIVKTQRNGVDAGSNTVQLSVTGLAQGTYYIRVTCDSNCESVLSKFVKE